MQIYMIMKDLFFTWLSLILCLLFVYPLLPFLRQFTSDANKPKTHSLVVGYVFCILGGIIGLHRFYYGRQKEGLIYLCSFGVVGLGVLFDLFYLPFIHKKAAATPTMGSLSFSKAFMLLGFGGFFAGFHRYYLGKWFKGLLLLTFNLFVLSRVCAVTHCDIGIFPAASSEPNLFDSFLFLVILFIWGRELWLLHDQIKAINTHNELYEFSKKLVKHKKKKVVGHVEMYTHGADKGSNVEYALVNIK